MIVATFEESEGYLGSLMLASEEGQDFINKLVMDRRFNKTFVIFHTFSNEGLAKKKYEEYYNNLK